ncbi:MAG: UDP-N-acetylmuramoyl-L-alanyl-D-glutamate--2,6-diaminopimelate ligase, partial [Erysipelotrichaceae bacterium]|nr:UDP-N-acetylmuramoyl-L-alanyl-D-glutamate--2,6-diaminopimelate ligase [Erysipelotrichaceae bacterium]
FLRTVSSKKIICVFGCGGNRDSIKRPLMGKTATKFSDLVIVTSDNPRDEDPNKIIEEICTGCDENVLVEPDRVKAIEMALTMSSKNDIIVLIGKGNEPSLFPKGKMIPCTDFDVVQRYLKED